ncbi:hypothetical protein M9Y10_045203 [Tritrichomonas musculus]|uniref:MULE transposase domain-containing protein n=1 Tax=Tritrichomonas musculus TaxID=1915356 RepID=A0ABR2JVV3_9EUKA
MDVTTNSMQELLDVDNSFVLSTNQVTASVYKKSKSFIINPQGIKWNFSLLSIYLNELQDYFMDVDNSCRIQTNTNGEQYFFMKFYSSARKEESIIINIKKNSLLILVKASKNYIDSWDDIKLDESHVQKQLLIKLDKPSSNSLINRSSFYYYTKSSFSQALISFICSFNHMKISNYSKDTVNIIDFYGFYIKHEKYDSMSLNDLLKSFEGYLHLTLTENNNTNKILDKCYIKDQKYYILKGTYISPLACNLIRSINTAGIMLDTTWTVLNHYVTSLPTVVIGNVGIPIGISFSLAEDSDIYNDFFYYFKNSYGYNITDFISVVESDQGKALKKAVMEQNMQHLCCLRHLLVSLGTSKYSQQIGNLVSSTSNYDFQELKKLYESSWSFLSDSNEIELLNKLLNKVGLALVDGKIEIQDTYRWMEVSMQIRPYFCMPSCTNQVESCHGHLNAMTPRRNMLWSSIARIIKEMLNKVHRYKNNFMHNYATYKRKIKRILHRTPEDVMNSMIQHYQTSIDDQQCHCGEAILISSMLNRKIPCSHLAFLGMQFPIIEPPFIDTSVPITGEIFFEYEIANSIDVYTDSDYYSFVRNYAVKIIKKYSHNKNKKNEITSFVQEKLNFNDPPTQFALGYPVEVFKIIDEGIMKFYIPKKHYK